MTYMREVNKNLDKLQTRGKTLFLAQDQGLEHGPKDLPGKTIDPDYIFNIAEKGEFDGFICQKGLAEKYSSSYKVNLVIKVNGKLNPSSPLGLGGDPYSPITCSVKKAVELGAKAIGFTNFPGSEFQNKILEDFKRVQEEAHDFGLPVTSWMYPRGKKIDKLKGGDLNGDVLEYAAREGLELGADMLKMKYNGNPEDMKRQIRAGGKARMLMAGGAKTNTSKEFLAQIKEVNECGIHGFAIGRNIWQHEKPVEMSRAIRDVQIRNKSVYDALKRLENIQ
ncbi:MAG: fructose-bisphosphate aldolase [Candidatus Woesearchaeota archaeon]|jgi:class I fructose-bisphosphate aldolase|nr:fructose-bisphosphate aldolase [Candidatus Woesearchaeota archaeon]